MTNIRHLALLPFVIWHSALLLAAEPVARSVSWPDLPAAVQFRLEQAGVTPSSFNSVLVAITGQARARVRDGDFDHLVFYVLQSTHFTTLPSIEPAVSAREFVTGGREGNTADPPPAVRARISAFLKALDGGDRDARLAYFRAMLSATPAAERRHRLAVEYARAMRFLYRKEFSARGPDAVAGLYAARGLSTDTAVEAGYAVQAGLGVVKGLDPARRIRRVLIVGPGIDLAPRTGMLEVAPPESYQPWAVIDALVGLGLSRLDDLEVVGADINPRVVDHLHASRQAPPLLHLVSGLGESDAVSFVPGYREYFTALGRSVGSVGTSGGAPPGHLAKTVAVSAAAARTLRAEPLDIVTERLNGETFDLVIATNILPYFGSVDLLLALSNIAGMLAPGGMFLHNDTRPEVQEDAAAAGLAAEQLRQVIIADVKGAPPLADTIVLHRRR
jgi:hypothetical protein